MFKNVASFPNMTIFYKTYRTATNTKFNSQFRTISISKFFPYFAHYRWFKFPSWRSFQDIFGIPSKCNSGKNYSERQTFLIGPVANTKPLSIIFKDIIIALIALLPTWGRPSAIGKLIITVYVNSVYTMRWARARPHIFKKVFEFTPSIAYRNSASPIILIFRNIRIAAATQHISPIAVFLCFFHISIDRTFLNLFKGGG